MKQIVHLPFILLVAVFSGRAGNVIAGLSDTIAPHLINITDERTIRLLTSDPVYKEYWFNDMTFTYDSVRVGICRRFPSFPSIIPEINLRPPGMESCLLHINGDGVVSIMVLT